MDHDRLSWNHRGALHSSSTGPTFEPPAQWGPGRKHQPPSCRSVVPNGASVCSPSACATEGLADMPLLPVHSTRIVLGAQLPEPGQEEFQQQQQKPWAGFRPTTGPCSGIHLSWERAHGHRQRKHLSVCTGRGVWTTALGLIRRACPQAEEHPGADAELSVEAERKTGIHDEGLGRA